MKLSNQKTLIFAQSTLIAMTDLVMTTRVNSCAVFVGCHEIRQVAYFLILSIFLRVHMDLQGTVMVCNIFK